MEVLSSTTTIAIVQDVPETEEAVKEKSMKTEDEKETDMEAFETTSDQGLNDTAILPNEGGKR